VVPAGEKVSEIIKALNCLRISRVAGVEDSFAGKTRWNYPNLRWGGAVATSAATRC